MQYDELAKTLGGIGAALAALGASWKWLPKACGRLRDFITANRGRAVVNGLQTLHLVYNALERAQDHGATRCVIFEAHNSGGVPRINSPFYTSAVHWVSDNETDEARIAGYMELQVDAAYVRMLVGLQETGFYHFVTRSEQDCFLKRIYEASSIESAALFSIGIVANSYIYISFASPDPKGYSQNQLTELRLIAGTIKRAIKVK